MIRNINKAVWRRDRCIGVQGSFTVETALLMPVILLVLFGLIYLDFHYVNSMNALSAAGEEAITEKDWTDFLVIAADQPSRSVEESRSERTVSMTSETKGVFSGMNWAINMKASYEIIRPVSRLRRLRSLRGAL